MMSHLALPAPAVSRACGHGGSSDMVLMFGYDAPFGAQADSREGIKKLFTLVAIIKIKI